MSSAGWRGPVAGVAMLAALASANAQSTAELKARALRAHSLSVAADSIEGRRRRADSASFAPTDTLVVGGPMLLLPERYRERAVEAAARAFGELTPELKGNLDSALTVLIMVVYRPGDRWRIDSLAALAAGRPYTVFVALDSNGSALDLAEAFRTRVATHIEARLDATAAHWIGSWIPVRPHGKIEREIAYTRLATQPSRPARGCIEGDIEQCALALRITLPRDTVTEWYGPNDRREQVRRWLESGSPIPLDTAHAARCLEGDDSSCVLAVRSMPASLWPAPAHAGATESFMESVLRHGDHNSLRRFMRDSLTPLPLRLERAGGRPLRTMLAEWRGEIVAARPRSSWPARGERWTSLVGILLLAGGALARRVWT